MTRERRGTGTGEEVPWRPGEANISRNYAKPNMTVDSKDQEREHRKWNEHFPHH